MPSARNVAANIGLAIVGFAVFQGTALAGFTDVSSRHPNYDAIQYVQDRGIVEGYLDGTFRPDKKITRAEFLKIIVEARVVDYLAKFGGGPPPAAERCFLHDSKEAFHRRFGKLPDIDFAAWYADYVCNALQYGLIQGYPDGTIRPSAHINFVEAAKIITNALHLDSRGPTASDGTTPWFTQYVGALEDKYAIPLSIASFDQQITRGEMAEVIYRLMAGITTKPSATYVGLEGRARAGNPPPTGWRTYQNDRLGFRMQLPANVSDRDVPSSEVIVLEDGDRAYVVRQRYFDFIENRTKTATLATMPADVARIPGWRISVRTVNTENELLQFVRSQFGATCALEPHDTRTGDEDTFNLRIRQSGAEGDCFVNYVYAIKYSPTLRRVAAWAIGQSYSFVNTNTSETFDAAMEESFHFIAAPAPSPTDRATTYRNALYRFSLRLPAGAARRGEREVFNLPFSRGTTLQEKFMTILEGANTVPCTSPETTFRADSGTDVTINDIVYRKETGREHGMSQIYDYVRYTTYYPSYSGSVCTSFTFTLHSVSQDPYDVPPPVFDKAKESQAFDDIMSSVKFE